MALLSDDMRTLAQNLLQDYESRMEAVADLRTNVRQWLNNSRTVQRALSAEQRQKLGEQRSGLATDTFAFINTIHAEQRQKFDEYMLSLRGQVADTLKEIDQAHQVMSAEQRQKLGEQRSGLATDTAAFINTIHAEQRQKLDEYMLSLRGQVAETREKYQTDQAEAAKVWANLSQLKQKNRMTLDVTPRVKKGSATSSQTAESAGRVASHAESSVAADDLKVIHGIGPAEPSDAVDELTVIHGIGPSPAEPSVPVDELTVINGIGHTMARHLSDAGITSFRQLAASNPEQLHLILGKYGKLANVETWITQAQNLIR